MGFGSAMRNFSMNDAQDPYEHEEYAMGENLWVGNDDIGTNGKRFQETPLVIAATMRSLIKAQEEKHQLNVAML